MSELVNKSEVLDIWNNYWITDMTTLDAEDQLRELATVELKSAPQLKENQLKTIKSWGNLKAGEFGQDWTEDDELTYRELFGESLMVLPDEVEEVE